MGKPVHSPRHVRIICIGAGAAGLCFAYKLQRSFEKYTLTLYDKNDGVGGVWYENTYPGCACDFPAHNYTYSFEPKPDFSQVYATASEVRGYFEQFAFRYDLNRYVRTKQEAIGATWQPNEGTWVVQLKDLSTGTQYDNVCDILINATGVLNAWVWPDIQGLHTFKGKLLHSARWEKGIDLKNKRVGLIGNGSSGQQILPAIQPAVNHLTTFIRQPAWTFGAFSEAPRPYTEAEIETFKTDPDILLEKRKQFEKFANGYWNIVVKGSDAQAGVRAFVEAEMKKKITKTELHDKLVPSYGVSCSRPATGINYLEALSASNVDVVIGSIKETTETGVVDSHGKEHPLDVLICATGFDTSYKPRFPLIGELGVNLQDQWKDSVKAYMATAVAGFPNYFMFCGPNNPFGSGAYLATVEAQADYILKFCDRWQTENILSFSPKAEAVEDFLAHAAKVLQTTVWVDNCTSWYKNHTKEPLKLLAWPGSGLHFIEAMSEVRADDYNVVYQGNRFAWLGNGYSQTELDPDADLAYYIRKSDDRPYLSKVKRRKVLTRLGNDQAKPHGEAKAEAPGAQ